MLASPIDAAASLQSRDVSKVVNRHVIDCENDAASRGSVGHVVAGLSSYSMNFRILGPHERGRFAPDAWGQLLALARTGVVTSSELEQLIERALVQIDGRIALDDLRALVEGAGLSAPATEGRETVH